MSEKRKPEYTLSLRKQGKSSANKIELFSASYWLNKPRDHIGKWRLRVNGKWWPKGKKRFVTTTEAKELTFKIIQQRR